MVSRGQAHTLEGVVASLVLLSGLVFALQVTAVTPLSASTSNQFIENQQQSSAEGVLATAEETGALERAVLFWDEADDRFHGANEENYYTTGGPPNAFGEMLNRTFDGGGVAFNVYFTYVTDDDRLQRKQVVYRGEPSDNAVTASRLLTISDDDVLYAADGTATGRNVSQEGSTGFYMPDAQPGSGVYNVVKVEVVAWRM